jgi:hypothetical protein
MEWIIDNKEILLSGLGAAIVGAILTAWLTKNSRTKQKQRSGKNSKNIQAGRDIKL